MLAGCTDAARPARPGQVQGDADRGRGRQLSRRGHRTVPPRRARSRRCRWPTAATGCSTRSSRPGSTRVPVTASGPHRCRRRDLVRAPRDGRRRRTGRGRRAGHARRRPRADDRDQPRRRRGDRRGARRRVHAHRAGHRRQRIDRRRRRHGAGARCAGARRGRRRRRRRRRVVRRHAATLDLGGLHPALAAARARGRLRRRQPAHRRQGRGRGLRPAEGRRR